MILDVKDLRYDYSSSISTFNFNFQIMEKQVVALLGNSGAGKSTLIHLLGGLLKPLRGKIFMKEQDISVLPPHQRGIALLFQSFNSFYHLSVFENIALGFSPTFKTTPQEKEHIFLMARDLYIDHVLDKKVQDLSRGQQQRVGLARCLLQNKPLMVLDEPFSCLEPSLRKELNHLLREKARALGKTILMVTHFPEEAQESATNILFMDQGQLHQNFSVAEFFGSQEGNIQDYLGKTFLKR